ncbi:Uncharacterized conserved protein YbaA, DUF1428 family [Paracoccus alcaliphilus]|uniref:Uncharacterized conserved protein YbaA, DUF1428 family n=1 Tax=Paracoccus alcaliphilus TaxID=34002 RepID=A0A1H8JGB3_9RHOB|nr:DUF1428 domain-containing protein [Paracoccus alcaliphilus]WCR18149.1 DUF1428 domain-containing protein [Paracoccus alcaliphilus]SEN79750.1 Uncharacterized conserved protein YbaA, DUF1428 family [Paracoccus alcaliphilus]
MTYYSGFVAAVPTANRQAYIDHATQSWPIFQKRGATRMVECWGEDVTRGKQTDFYRATGASDDETPVFSWIEWPDRETCDKAWADMMADPDMQQMPDMPFDGMRMFWGGFSPIVTEGESRPGSYVQGFVLAAPADRKQAYIDMARSATEMFARLGATHQIECWGEDVPHGKVTDFYRATDAKEGEVPLFSWIEWPDRETCDKAAKQMEAEMESMEMPTEMPFDGMRMFWGGFTPIVDKN